MGFLDHSRPTAAADPDGTVNGPGPSATAGPEVRRGSLGKLAARILMHGGFLLIAVACLAAYEHFRVAGNSGASLASLVAAGVFGFAPIRDIVRVIFRVEGRVLHVVHGLGGLALGALPLAGVVSGAPVLTHSAMAPFAIMGAAQAVMHQDQPRTARQAEALRRFAASLPEVAQFANARNLATPEDARRAVAVLSDLLAKAQALGETELESDPGFRSALSRVSARLGANLGLDAVDLALGKMAANAGTAGAVPALRARLASARRAIAGAGPR